MPCQHKEETQKCTISVYTLIERGVTKLKNGVAVIPNASYITDKPKDVNHQTEGEKAFKLHGIQGVYAYRDGIMGLTKEQG